MARENIYEYAAELRRAGWHKLDEKDLERRLGRRLTKFERRALIVAIDPRKKKADSGKKKLEDLKHSKVSVRSVQGGAPGLGKRNSGRTVTNKHGPIN